MKGPRFPSVQSNQHSFARVPNAEIQRSTFDRSHGYKTTFDASYIIPFYVDEALPGDTFSGRLQAFARLNTPIKPIMDNLWMDIHFFACPIRLVWTNFVKFMGEQVNPGDSTSFLVPVFGGYTAALHSLSDYMGIPGVNQVTTPINHNSLPFRCYNLIYNTYYRDENLINSAVVDMGDGPDTITNYVLRKRGKRHDYFTSCLPFLQKGVAVTIPLGTSAPVVPVTQWSSSPIWRNAGGTVTGGQTLAATSADVSGVNVNSPVGNWTAGEVLTWQDPQLKADLSTATAATINQLRQAFQIQRLLERDARGGTRYIEKVKAHFGVTSPDARLQRPEYLGGGSVPVIISPIAQTAPENATEPTPQGNLSGIGTATVDGIGFTKSFTEHMYVFGFVSVRADLTYQQGLNRMWSRSTIYDFFWPALAHIGEQSVFNREIYCTGGANDALVFGYQERYAEYRYKPSQITGLFRSTATGTLDIWHLSQKFTALPTLGQTFIEEDVPVDRVVATPSEPHFTFDSWLKLICARPMPVFGVPGLIDHF